MFKDKLCNTAVTSPGLTRTGDVRDDDGNKGDLDDQV